MVPVTRVSGLLPYVRLIVAEPGPPGWLNTGPVASKCTGKPSKNKQNNPNGTRRSPLLMFLTAVLHAGQFEGFTVCKSVADTAFTLRTAWKVRLCWL